MKRPRTTPAGTGRSLKTPSAKRRGHAPHRQQNTKAHDRRGSGAKRTRAEPKHAGSDVSGRTIGARLLRWYRRHGRKDLPWKRGGDPYHVWLSEVMLQQTQVTTVIPYFERFVARFPTIAALARADVNAVLHQWSGLGYYARGRNLHRAARMLVDEHGGRIPRTFDAVARLPGVGRSTAGAILALAYDERHPILDGNVKRVLARYHAIDQPPQTAAAERRLWELAERHTPRTHVADYTQAIMDLGATLCRRTDPHCPACPLRADCAAHAAGDPEAYPSRAARKPLPARSVRMLLIRDGKGYVLLERRPPAGIWGGLWALPQCGTRDVRTWCRDKLGLEIEPAKPWPRLRHTFSHFHLDIEPVPARLVKSGDRAMESRDMVWYNCRQPDERGLAAPVIRLLDRLRSVSAET